MNDEFYMNLALDLAEATQGQTSPNPVVGAVIVKDGVIIGLGAHLKAGEPHAEIHALRMAGEKAAEANIYVTLEPCSHHGRTPPCADAIIHAGIKRVIISSIDPNPLVAGKGIEKLKEVGIEVTSGVLAERGNKVNEVFFHYIRNKVPYVTLKQAITLDGKIAAKTGHSKWITGEDARSDVHNERSKHAAILVGINTVIQDNPSLTNRNENPGKQPVRIILDTHMKIPADRKVLQDRIAETWIITGSEVPEAKIAEFENEYVRIIKLPSPVIEIRELLERLGEEGIPSIYVEGGQAVNASFLKEKAVNRLVTYIAPKIIGGNDAPGMVGDLQVLSMDDALGLRFQSIEQIGEDLKITSSMK
ncbi:bifunctional diaminohydroxyphosphoribosylaminopyrimidine deaminase/5-amino-6-(5-phosphoribosylamino)uracil reductase RibD [Peribacillus cavernae]|uniref:Riboflavin biosynthesis protein RibD n=1 Tax=Peribacillus cavernae TaxID=1674310 RepID=A0A433HKC8_9BACI|nr:bifunctional diaminohydroxyphosphoribosylaminopyrimidine deaminase/5-amino-6-(5-phosphoribosylamino)uracil reductase RibD [Peribacillus cavernae]MDQ0219086.1 diaminohydroxyphosphoribosylaminopyrimidine deaminase/5-amino-6-(5-phosphoribosylamino)uracil reductase [Peribacillus cavernae]RUQ28679.1 bifunctional diaminohydroxyphosphoribosylaminopyrimidine deaminase/5-amino-6-(5-phosphoribosylamino)uracil reductase RibD [Peribacillus cavernae]